jgi:hypothetical protein
MSGGTAARTMPEKECGLVGVPTAGVVAPAVWHAQFPAGAAGGGQGNGLRDGHQRKFVSVTVRVTI